MLYLIKQIQGLLNMPILGIRLNHNSPWNHISFRNFFKHLARVLQTPALCICVDECVWCEYVFWIHSLMWVCNNLVSDRDLLSAQARRIETQSEDFKGKFSFNTLSASFNWPYLHNLLTVFLSQAASICLSNFRAFESLWRWSTILINNDPSFCIFLKGCYIAIVISIVEFGGNPRNKSFWNHTTMERF